MKQAIQDFIGMLRKSGIRVSLSEILDCMNGLEYVDLLDKKEFRSLLKATLIKRSEDHPEFERLFRLYFEKHRYSIINQSPDHITTKALSILEQANGVFSQLFRMFMQEGAEGVIPSLFQNPRNSNIPGMSEGMASFLTSRTKLKIKEDHWPDQLNHLLSLLDQNSLTSEQIDRFQELIEDRMDHLQVLMDDFIENEKKSFKSWKARIGNENLLKKGFGTLSSSDLDAVREAVQELVKRIKDEYALRQRRRKLGKIDIKRTLRKSQQYGGLPVEIFWRRRNKSKGKIIALCDISSSVRNASQFMLTLLYSLQDQFSKVRSFIFVSDIGEVTDFFEEQDIDNALHQVLHDGDINYYSSTSYSNVFKQFYDDYFDIVNSRTTVIIIGDARNNYAYDTSEWALEKIKSKARRIIWLNPERRMLWGSGDSIMYSYKKYCYEVRECWNVSQLMNFINDLIL